MKNKYLSTYMIGLLLLGANTTFADTPGEEISATTANGDQVILKPNGRWIYVNTEKAEAAAKIAKEYPENKVCPPGSQGGWFGTKCILPGDKAFNRKSRIGK